MTKLGALLISIIEPLKNEPSALATEGLTVDDIDTALRVLRVLFRSEG